MEASHLITEIKGVGVKTTALFSKLHIETIKDLISYFPRGYDHYEEALPVGELCTGKVQSVRACIVGTPSMVRAKGMVITHAQAGDASGRMKLTWFRMPYLKKALPGGSWHVFRGMVQAGAGGMLFMEQPRVFSQGDYETLAGTWQPKYTLTSGLTNHMISKCVRQALEELELPDYLPEEIRSRYRLIGFREAMEKIHFPGSQEDVVMARRRLVFDEFLAFLIQIKRQKKENAGLLIDRPLQPTEDTDRLIAALPYQLTGAQRRVWKQIEADLTGHMAMNRLVQGDVGSGKTILAFLALLVCSANSRQGCLMAPTEVLAVQHFEALTEMTEKYGLCTKPILLTGSMTSKQKKEAYARIKSGDADVIIGTHALIQDKVEYRDLALVVTDEQHRFGVRQRECLANKGEGVHVLVMSATPIPRTLAIILYGDLDISVIDELPANRLPIKNCVVDTGYRNKAYNFMKKQIAEGRQCYVICPMVEESETMEAENVTDYTVALQEEMGDQIQVACLHGKMKQAQKDDIMDQFGRNEIQILVSTTVIEVGIDVPNATVMMIENAERFGLAQLHQLRGRVGRGKYQSYCIFMSASKSKETKERLDILNHSNDGFKIASEDLRLRGPGDLFGIRQSGLMNFKLGDIYQDAKILQMANEAADQLTEEDEEWIRKLPNYENAAGVVI